MNNLLNVAYAEENKESKIVRGSFFVQDEDELEEKSIQVSKEIKSKEIAPTSESPMKAHANSIFQKMASLTGEGKSLTRERNITIKHGVKKQKSSIMFLAQPS